MASGGSGLDTWAAAPLSLRFAMSERKSPVGNHGAPRTGKRGDEGVGELPRPCPKEHCTVPLGSLGQQSWRLAMLAAVRRASSRVSSLSRSAAPRLCLKVGRLGERLAIAVADDEALPIQLRIGLLDGPGRREVCE